MQYRKPAIIGACVLAFGAAVAVMLPPTTPIGGAKITSTEHQGFSPVQSAPPAAEPKPDYPTSTPPMASASNDVADDHAVNSDTASDRDMPASQASATQAPSPAPAQRQTYAAVRPNPRFAYADDADGSDGREYKQGYRWARRGDVQDWRDCRALPGAQVDGCLAYIQDTHDRRDDGDDDDRPY